MHQTNQRLSWQKYLTREYSFLYISYAIDCYKIMQKVVGTTITYDISHGNGKLVNLYGTKEDIQNSYKMIDAIAARNQQEIVDKMDKYDTLIAKNYELFNEIAQCDDKLVLKDLLIDLDKLFLETLCYYLFFVYLGYAGDLSHVKSFLEKYNERFKKIRLYTIDVDMDKQFPKLFAKYDNKLKDLAPYMSRSELINFITSNAVDFEKVENRKKKYLVITKAGETMEFAISDIDHVLEKELALLKVNQVSETIKGRIACPGKVEGPAVIVFSVQDYEKIKEGDILVTSMTKPDIIPYLNRVKGIITNDGGALSHASIISRELNIPCIAGTGNATDIFKDNDIIELDASKGFARKK